MMKKLETIRIASSIVGMTKEELEEMVQFLSNESCEKLQFLIEVRNRENDLQKEIA